MNVRKITHALLLVFTAALAVTGCSDDPASSGDQPPGMPRNVKAAILNATSATIEWSAPADSSGIDGYIVWWVGNTEKDSGSVELDGQARSHTATGLRAGQHYTINVASGRGTFSGTGTFSDPATIDLNFTGDPGPVPPQPSGLMVSAAGDGKVKLRWQAPADPNVTGYMVSWTNAVTQDSSSVTYGLTTSATVSNLANGRSYTFYLRSMRGAVLSEPLTATGATAPIYTLDVAHGGTLRLYEQSSDKWSGLLIDPARGGPKGVFLMAEPADVQFAWYLAPKSDLPGSVDTVLIGSGRGFMEYVNRNLFDPTVYVSGSTFFSTSLAEAVNDKPLDQLVLTDMNTRVFAIPAPQSGGMGQGFVYRIGAPGDYHYGRVFVKNNGGSLVQGTAPNRYIELEVSYQAAANLPYGKVAPQTGSPSGAVFHSYVRR